MNLLADESVDKQIVDRLRMDGHDVLFVAEMEPGIPDELVLNQANTKQAVLITADKDFGELVYRLRRIHNGIILIRLDGFSSERKAEIISEVVFQHAGIVSRSFIVISPGQVRIRRHLP